MCVLKAGATEYVKFFISVLMLCDIVCSYVVRLIRAAAETSLLNHENKYLDVGTSGEREPPAPLGWYYFCS